MWYTKDLIALKLDKLLNNLESKTGQARQIKKEEAPYRAEIQHCLQSRVS